MSGVPGHVQEKDAQEFRGIDRLVDVMQGNRFAFMLIAKPIERRSLVGLRSDVFQTYEYLSSLKDISLQRSLGKGSQMGFDLQKGSGDTIGGNWQDSFSVGGGGSRGSHETWGSASGDKESSSHHDTSKDKQVQWHRDRTRGVGGHQDHQENQGIGFNVSSNENDSVSASVEIINKGAENWVRYFDEVLIPRLDYACGKGAFVVTMALLGENRTVVQKLSNVARSIFAGEAGNMVPLTQHEPSAEERTHIASFSLPYVEVTGQLSDKLKPWLPCVHAKASEYSGLARIGQRTVGVLYSGSWMSVRDLALMASLPRKEVVGLRLKEEIEFGLNVPHLGEDDIAIGHLVKSGNVCKDVCVGLSRKQLDRHVFVAGVTGGGKTTTCQTLLLSSGIPFWVIEPAKTEYRGLRFAMSKDGKSLCPDLLVFTVGDENVAPFRMNPFELIGDESVTARVDMLMASITAAFDMEAAIPQLIERAIYACYHDYGWDVGSSKNLLHDDPFADGVFAFPTLSDVLHKVETVVAEQGFDDRLKKDYVGSIKARLQGLTLGAKGFMLDCPRSVDFLDLLERKVVFELESIPNAAQKCLIIGFILTNLLQAVKSKFYGENRGRKIGHITLVEEAHRLLAKVEPGGNPSQKQAAETFADMLAEIRKYGESLVIADQIPSKLTPEVMKNTNTKIIHRLFARDDKESVGHTMGLEDDQSKFLSNLQVGRAVVFNGNWPKAVQVQVLPTYDTSSSEPEGARDELRNAVLDYFGQKARQILSVECRQIGSGDGGGLEKFPILRHLLKIGTVEKVVDRVMRFPAYADGSLRPYLESFLKALSVAKEAGDLVCCRAARDVLSLCCNYSNPKKGSVE